MENQIEKQEELDKLVKPVIQYLRENHTPHHAIIIDCMRAELVESSKVAIIEVDYD